MSKAKFFTAVAGTAFILTAVLGTSVAFASGGSTTTSTPGTLTSSGLYTYPKVIQVTITSADTSLQPVTPAFQFANAAPTFTPSTSYDGSGTFTLPAGYTAQSATSVTVDLAESNPSTGIYVYDVGVPVSMQSSTYSHLFVYSNYQWSQGGTAVDNFSTLVNLVQQLPELPFAVAIPALIVGGWFLKRRSKKKSEVVSV